MKVENHNIWFIIICFSFFLASPLYGDVLKAAKDGFQIRVQVEANCTGKEAYAAFVDDLSKWWDSSHTYSGDAKNLSMDLKQKCMLEKLPDGGFVRHMEIVYCQPGRVFRMNGGLGPLQSMGVAGSLTVSFKEVEGKTKVTLVYLVSGSSLLKLDQIAAPVNQVLTGQMRRFEKHAASLTAKAELKQ